MDCRKQTVFLLRLLIVLCGVNAKQQTRIDIYGPNGRNISNTNYEYTTEESLQLTCNFTSVRGQFQLAWTIDGVITKVKPITKKKTIIDTYRIALDRDHVVGCVAQETPLAAGGTNFTSLVNLMRRNTSRAEPEPGSGVRGEEAEGGEARSWRGPSMYVYVGAAVGAAAGGLLLAVLLAKYRCKKKRRNHHSELQPVDDAADEAAYAQTSAQGAAAARGALYTVPVPKSQRNKNKRASESYYNIPYDYIEPVELYANTIAH